MYVSYDLEDIMIVVEGCVVVVWELVEVDFDVCLYVVGEVRVFLGNVVFYNVLLVLLS